MCHFSDKRRKMEEKLSFRDLEVLEAIRRDDLAFVISCRSEKNLCTVPAEDVNPILLDKPSPLMVSAFYGATKCFKYFIAKGISKDYRDENISFFIFFMIFNFLFIKDIASISQQPEET